MKKILQRIIALALFYDGLPRPGGLQVRQNGEGAASRNTAHVFADGSHPEVAVHPPLLSPRVLNDPVVVLVIADCENGVVHRAGALLALVRGKRPVFIESELWDDLERHGDWLDAPHCRFQHPLMSLGNVNYVLNEDGGRVGLVAAKGSVLGQIRIFDLQAQTAIVANISLGEEEREARQKSGRKADPRAWRRTPPTSRPRTRSPRCKTCSRRS